LRSIRQTWRYGNIGSIDQELLYLVRKGILWFGFDMVGTLPLAFLHPKRGYVDVLVMFKTL